MSNYYYCKTCKREVDLVANIFSSVKGNRCKECLTHNVVAMTDSPGGEPEERK